MILSSSYLTVLKSLLLKDLLKQVKIQYHVQRHNQKYLKRHAEGGQDLLQCKADKSEAGLGQTTDISLRTSFFHSGGRLWEVPMLFIHIRIEMSENHTGYPLVSQQIKGNPKAFKGMQTLSRFSLEKYSIWLKCQEACCSITQGTNSRALEILKWTGGCHFYRGKKKA